MPTEKSTVLVVDDVFANLMIIEDLLAQNDIEVLTATNGKEGLHSAVENTPDLILLDIIMPGIDGFEVCEILKADEKTKEIPVIFLSGRDNPDDIVKGFEVGAVDYVRKPFNVRELLARVKTHLELKHYKDAVEKQNKKLRKEVASRKKAQKALRDNEIKYSGLITGLSDAVFRIRYPENEYDYISPAASKVFGYSKNSFYKTPDFINKIIHPDYADYYRDTIETDWGVAPTMKYKVIDPEGNERWIVQANKGRFDKDGNLIAIEGIYRNITTEEELSTQKDELEKINKNITSSIRYAQFIQKAVLPSTEFLKQFIPEHFILYIPRDIVSGDFYWIKQVNNFVAIAAADCTGHGVPGAFMSMLGIALLNEVVRLDEHPTANGILNELRKRVKTSLHQESVRGTGTDGMDMSLCIVDIENKQIQYSGANNPLFIIREDEEKGTSELIHIRPDRMPIGVYIKERPFTNHVIQLQTNDQVYQFTDGFIDQFGGERQEKFKMKRFKKLLLKIHKRPMAEQQELLYAQFDEWRGGINQLDDIMIIGFKILDNYGNIDFF